MKKTFLKATLFSLLLGAVPAAMMTSCQDYGDDIDRLNQRDDTLQKEINDKLGQQSEALKDQVNKLETALSQLKNDAAAANAAAQDAANAAVDAKNSAVDALAAAANAQAAGDAAGAAAADAAAAAATANAAAAAANAEALAAQAAAAQAKADAIEEAKKQVEALSATVDSQINALKQEFGDKYDTVAAAVAEAATKQELNDAVATLNQAIADSKLTKGEVEEMLAEYIQMINKNTTDISALSGKVDGIDTTLNTLGTDLGNAKNDISALQTEVGKNTTDIAANAASIATETARINTIVETTIPGLETRIDDVNTALDAQISAYNTFVTQTNTQLAALETFKNNYEELLSGLADELEGLHSDITTLTNNLQSLSSTVAGLQTTLTSVNSTLQSIQTTLSTINSDLDDLKTRITDAETALTTAQADIVNNATEITTLKGDVVTINTEISTINSTLADLQSDLTSLGTEVTSVKGDITTINGTITGIQTDVQANTAAIGTINGTLTAVQNDILAINKALSTLASVNAKRLTSLTLVPTAYVGGIPTIDFYTASFTPLGALDATTGIYAAASATATPVIVTNNDTQVLYRMNPAGVGLDDIDAANVTFVQQIATSRAAGDAVVKVVGVAKNAEGQLVVTANKAEGVTGSIDNAGSANSIYTVALRVPIAEKNYYTWTDADGKTVTEDAADAVVYSEFCRVSEATFTPEIAHVDDKGALVDHFSDATIWTASPAVAPVAEVPFSYADGEGFDLTPLVAGCMLEGTGTDVKHNVMTAEQLASFGFSFEYSVPKQAYNVDGVNQQLYASVTAEGILTPINPAAQSASSRVGRTPIISVVMKYGNQVVAQRFFKVEYVIDMTTDPFTIAAFEEDLACEGFDAEVMWSTFITEVINKLPFPMTPAEFIANYTLTAVDGITASLDAVPAANAQATTPVFTWAVAVSDFAKMGGKNVDLEKELTFTSTTLPEFTVTLTGVVNWPTALPTLGTADAAYWTNGTMQILPQAMPQPYDGTTTAEYNTNVFSGRPAPYLNGLLECANWDIQVAGVSDKNFAAGATAPSDEEGAYQVVMGTDVAATIWAGADDHEAFGLDAADAAVGTTVTSMFFNIDNNEAGIALVEAEATVNLGWYIYLNGTENENEYTLNNTNLQIIKPLKSVNAGTIEPLTQNSFVQKRDLAEGMTITDCFNNVFTEFKVEDGEVTTDKTDYATYYDIQSVEFKNTLTITDEDGTNERDLSTLNMEAMVTEDGKLEFTGSGIALQQPIVLNVPVVVTHKWGVLNSKVTVTIKPGLN